MFVSADRGGAASSVILWDPLSARGGALAVTAVVDMVTTTVVQ
jgi:hypothetical protein